jgi:hypothetical protein
MMQRYPKKAKVVKSLLSPWHQLCQKASSIFQNSSSQVHTPQGCQIVCFQTKNPNFFKNLQGLGIENIVIFYDHLEYSTSFGIIYSILVWFVAIWYIFPVSVCLDLKNLATLHTLSQP